MTSPAVFTTTKNVNYETDTYIIRDSNDNSFLVPVHGTPSKSVESPEIVIHNASASDLDEDTLSELEAYNDGEVDRLLGRAMKDVEYDLDREYFATDEESDEEEGMELDDSEPGSDYYGSYMGKGRCH